MDAEELSLECFARDLEINQAKNGYTTTVWIKIKHKQAHIVMIYKEIVNSCNINRHSATKSFSSNNTLPPVDGRSQTAW